MPRRLHRTRGVRTMSTPGGRNMVTFEHRSGEDGLLVVDLQRFSSTDRWWPPGRGGPAGGDEPAATRQRGTPCHSTRDRCPLADHSNAWAAGRGGTRRGAGCDRRRQRAAEPHPELDVAPGDIIVANPRFGAFQVPTWRRSCAPAGHRHPDHRRDRTTCGVETTAREAATREFRVLFLRDGTATFAMRRRPGPGQRGGGPAGDLQHDRVRLRRGSRRPRRHHANRAGGTRAIPA